eukprot:scaffold5595_cov41-Prasinocladus_malaysianus.AAC.1
MCRLLTAPSVWVLPVTTAGSPGLVGAECAEAGEPVSDAESGNKPSGSSFPGAVWKAEWVAAPTGLPSAFVCSEWLYCSSCTLLTAAPCACSLGSRPPEALAELPLRPGPLLAGHLGPKLDSDPMLRDSLPGDGLESAADAGPGLAGASGRSTARARAWLLRPGRHLASHEPIAVSTTYLRGEHSTGGVTSLLSVQIVSGLTSMPGSATPTPSGPVREPEATRPPARRRRLRRSRSAAERSVTDADW